MMWYWDLVGANHKRKSYGTTWQTRQLCASGLTAKRRPAVAIVHIGEDCGDNDLVASRAQVVISGQFPLTTSLAEYLRYHLGLTGTKIGCGEVWSEP